MLYIFLSQDSRAKSTSLASISRRRWITLTICVRPSFKHFSESPPLFFTAFMRQWRSGASVAFAKNINRLTARSDGPSHLRETSFSLVHAPIVFTVAREKRSTRDRIYSRAERQSLCTLLLLRGEYNKTKLPLLTIAPALLSLFLSSIEHIILDIGATHFCAVYGMLPLYFTL